MDAASKATFDKHFSHVEIREGADGISVFPIWKDVDRPLGAGWGLKASHRSLADRLARAIRRGHAYSACTVATDVNGKTYINATSKVYGRQMNADLRRIGY